MNATLPSTSDLENLRHYEPKRIAELACVHLETVRRHIRQGLLPAVQHGKGWRIPHAAAVEYLTRGSRAIPNGIRWRGSGLSSAGDLGSGGLPV